MSEPSKTINQDGTSKSERPRDAATLVVVDMTTGEPRILMGKRHASQVFMPNKVVFPGGRVDDTDRGVTSHDELHASEIAKLMLEMKGHASPARARSIALAAVRETFEETGVVIGQRGPTPTGDSENWQAFFDAGFLPNLSCLSLFARAITPPGRTRRYDTRFFCVPVEAIAAQTGAFDDELSEINWYSVQETAELDLPPITRVIIEDLTDRLAAGPLGPSSAPIPFYHHRHGSFRRDLLNVTGNE